MSGADDLIFGLHAVNAALLRHPETVLELWLDRERDDRTLRELNQAAESQGIAVQRVARRRLDALVPGCRHQGVVARIRQVRTGGDKELLELLAGLKSPPLLLVLDGVQDPHNLGACLRSADAAGAHAVVIPRDRAAGLTAIARKVASGAAETVPLFQVANLARTLAELKQAGVWIAGLTGEAQQPIYDLDLSGPLALVLGAEGRGLRRLTRESCDWLVRIPMHGTVESLNVSVAAGVCLFEVSRQRGL